jgi:molybdopterin synthase catalytic subunit
MRDDSRFTIYDLRTSVVHASRHVAPERSEGGYTHHAAVNRQLTITTEPINEAALLSQRAISAGMGAVVYFLGVVRGEEDGRAITAIEYESFKKMAEHQFNLLLDGMEQRWPIESVRLVHRLGVVKVNEPSLWVEVVAPHREAAFAACQWLIDGMKRVVPIWKKPVV